MARLNSLEDALLMQDVIARITPHSQPRDLYDTARPDVIEEEDEDACCYNDYDDDDAAPSVNIPRYRDSTDDKQRKRSSITSIPPAISNAKTSIYRTANSIISQRTAIVGKSQPSGGIQYRSQLESVPATAANLERFTGWEMRSHPSERPVSIFSVTSGLRHSKPPSIMQPRIFQALPREVYACVLQQLEVLHFGRGAQSCTTCYLRDLYNIALTSRSWDKAARNKLYSSLWLPPPDSADTTHLKIKPASRLKLLRKTLRERGALAKLVREVKASELQQAFLQANYNEGQEIINDLASIVMACPSLERLVGFHWKYNHEFDRLNHALSTRPNLTERAWIIGKPINHGLVAAGKRMTQQDAFELYPGPTELFLHHHDVCTKLQTLFLHGEDGAGAMDFRSFVATFRKLTHLRHLHLSNFAAFDFNDRTLAALPTTLLSLRLEALDGVTDKGLLRFAQSPAAASLTSLSLIHQELVDLLILIAFLKFCRRLQRLAVVQDGSPGVAAHIPLFRPVFASSSLRRLHWDVLMPGPATDELAVSIAGGAFPELVELRAPCDRDGALQDLCRPRACVLLPEDGAAAAGGAAHHHHLSSRHKHSHSGGSNGRDSMSPNGSGLGDGYGEREREREAYGSRNIARARHRAQDRIDARCGATSPRSASFPTSSGSSSGGSAGGGSVAASSEGSVGGGGGGGGGIQIVVEEDGVVVERFSFEHVGTMGSRVEYCLEPDVEGSVDAVVSVADLMLGGPARGVGGGIGMREACTETATSGLGKRTWHRPRPRMRVVEVADFF
ncbi:hypothetical protein GTA08_BOTSDO05599 [Neofusicoccum parvum]|nr:hypothetical protein GTA08_BOTSDO05599 [Neofusicoccum parvum]